MCKFGLVGLLSSIHQLSLPLYPHQRPPSSLSLPFNPTPTHPHRARRHKQTKAPTLKTHSSAAGLPLPPRARMLPGQSPSVVFFLKGARTSGTILKRAGKRIRIQHDGGTCWVDLADLAESEGSVSSSATPPRPPYPPRLPPGHRVGGLKMTQSQPTAASAESIEAAPHLPLATPSTPPPILLTPAVQHQLKRHASGTERHVQGGAALPPLTPIDTLPTHPQLLMSLAFEAWWTNANWHSEWLELLEEAQQHHEAQPGAPS